MPKNSLLIVSRVGVGKLAFTRDTLCTSQDFTNFTPHNGELVFLAYYLKSESTRFLSFSQGMAIQGLTKDDLAKLQLCFPSLAEQQKIADCLSSVDELITAQDKKIQRLNAHKKGLMQQLFPAVDDSYPQTNQPPRQATPATPPEESQPPRQAAPATPPEEGNVKTVQASPQFPSSGGVPEGRGGGSQVISKRFGAEVAVWWV